MNNIYTFENVCAMCELKPFPENMYGGIQTGKTTKMLVNAIVKSQMQPVFIHCDNLQQINNTARMLVDLLTKVAGDKKVINNMCIVRVNIGLKAIRIEGWFNITFVHPSNKYWNRGLTNYTSLRDTIW